MNITDVKYDEEIRTGTITIEVIQDKIPYDLEFEWTISQLEGLSYEIIECAEIYDELSDKQKAKIDDLITSELN